METKEYFEKVMQDYNQHRNGRSLRKYCKEEGVDYDWLIEYKKNYPPRKLEPCTEVPSFIPLTMEEKKNTIRMAGCTTGVVLSRWSHG